MKLAKLVKEEEKEYKKFQLKVKRRIIDK